jgi:hypothetical protein
MRTILDQEKNTRFALAKAARQQMRYQATLFRETKEPRHLENARKMRDMSHRNGWRTFLG